LGEKEQFINELKERIRKSDELFLLAKKLFEEGYIEDAISRAYYSLYHLLTTYLLLQGETQKTHKGLLIRIGFEIKEGKLNKNVGKILRTLFQDREIADYDIFSFFSKEEVSNILNELEIIREEIKENQLNLENF
jgi:hypothetical protein